MVNNVIYSFVLNCIEFVITLIALGFHGYYLRCCWLKYVFWSFIHNWTWDKFTELNKYLFVYHIIIILIPTFLHTCFYIILIHNVFPLQTRPALNGFRPLWLWRWSYPYSFVCCISSYVHSGYLETASSCLEVHTGYINCAITLYIVTIII